eukprot:3713344-Amphidinium_carterae.1
MLVIVVVHCYDHNQQQKNQDDNGVLSCPCTRKAVKKQLSRLRRVATGSSSPDRDAVSASTTSGTDGANSSWVVP